MNWGVEHESIFVPERLSGHYLCIRLMASECRVASLLSIIQTWMWWRIQPMCYIFSFLFPLLCSVIAFHFSHPPFLDRVVRGRGRLESETTTKWAGAGPVLTPTCSRGSIDVTSCCLLPEAEWTRMAFSIGLRGFKYYEFAYFAHKQSPNTRIGLLSLISINMSSECRSCYIPVLWSI